MDPNPAISAHAAFPQSGHNYLSGKTAVSHFSKLEPTKNKELHIGVRYIKRNPIKIPIKCNINHVVLINRNVWVGF